MIPVPFSSRNSPAARSEGLGVKVGGEVCTQNQRRRILIGLLYAFCKGILTLKAALTPNFYFRFYVPEHVGDATPTVDD